MEIDPKDIVETARSSREAASTRAARLNATVAITVAVLATFMGICKVKDDNIVQAMQQAQADKLDHWAYYQARNLRQEVAEATVTQLELGAPRRRTGGAGRLRRGDRQIPRACAGAAQKKEDSRVQAELDQKTYDDLNYRDDQFDLCDALLAIAIAMLAVTALTGLWPLYWAALVPTLFGVLMGLAGLLAWPIHPGLLVRLLS